ncbi:MAG: hypothetical protein V7L20_25155 [Nostoc sp.]|uniref:hypothetical protein n=1 Tax=Nostoc sp. TaxID=1180 RepID=UPI002FF8E343
MGETPRRSFALSVSQGEMTRSKRSYAVGEASRREGFTLRYRLWRLPLGEDHAASPLCVYMNCPYLKMTVSVS